MHRNLVAVDTVESADSQTIEWELPLHATNAGTHNITSIFFILLESIVQPDELLMLSHNKKVFFGITGKRGACVNGEFNFILFAERIRYVNE